MTIGIIGHGAIIELETAEGSGSYIRLEKPRSGALPNREGEEIDATNMDSENGEREFISGLINGGELQFAFNWIPAGVTDEAIIAWADVRDRRNMRVTTPKGTLTVTFPAVYRNWETPFETDALAVATLTIRVAGAASRS